MLTNRKCVRLYEEIDTRAEPELRSFAVVKAVKDIIHLLQEHFEICIVSAWNALDA